MNYNETNISISDIFPAEIDYFKEESINKIFSLPKDKPCIESVCDVLIYPKVISKKLIRTETGFSNEGQKLTGFKLVVELAIEVKVTYVSDEPTQSIYAVHYETLKSMFIILPEYINDRPVYDLFNASRYTINPYVEHSYTKLLNDRDVQVCILMLLDVKFC